MPLIPVILELGCEVGFPSGEATIVGCMVGIAQEVGGVFGFSLTHLAGKGTQHSSNLIFLVYVLLQALGWAVVCLAPIQLKRLLSDKSEGMLSKLKYESLVEDQQKEL